MEETPDIQEQSTRAVLFTIDYGSRDLQTSLDELTELVRTIGGETQAQVTQSRAAPDSARYLGAGKLDELKELCAHLNANLAVADDELTPVQQRTVEKVLNDLDDSQYAQQTPKIRVIDRTMLILEIFAQRANSGEGRLQAELAHLRYMLPRVRGQWYGLSRQAGGAYTRGAGESKQESDRRAVARRIRRLEAELQTLEKRRELHWLRRKKDAQYVAAIVGYTNAGKSTLLNALTAAGALAEDKLFATLDPTARALKLPGGREILLVDTVGFVRRLPHSLVEAFRSTLETTVWADMILHVLDVNDPDCGEKMRVTAALLEELRQAHGRTQAQQHVMIFNKCDLQTESDGLPSVQGVRVSAKTGEGLDALLRQIERVMPPSRVRVQVLLPYGVEGGAGARLRAQGQVFAEEFRAEGVYYDALCPADFAQMLAPYLLPPQK
jgi:GTP-binding protein HflX